MPLDGISYVAYLNTKEKGEHVFEFIDGFYDDNRYDKLVAMFRKYMFIDEYEIWNKVSKKR
jgi:hypothetical protein